MNLRGNIDKSIVDIVTLAALLLSSVYAVYFSTQSNARIFFLLLLFLFLISKKDYLWFAYIFIIISRPGHLFSDFSGLSTTRLPLYTFLSGMSFSVVDLFLILALVKALLYGRKSKLLLRTPLLLLLVYGCILIFLSVIAYGTTLDSLLFLLRNTFTYSVIFSFPLLVGEENKIQRFTFLIFPVVFFIFFTEIYYLMTGGDDFVNLLAPGYRVAVFTEEGELRPVTGGVILVFFSYVFALFQLQHQRKSALRNYLLLIVVVCFVTVFLSATRVWIIMLCIILLCYLLFTKIHMKKVIQLGFSAILVAIVALSFLPVREGIIGSWERVSQIGYVAQGRFQQAHTFDTRFNERLPRLLVGLRQNWLLGWGFSDRFLWFSDEHVGNFNLLLQAGIVGFGLFVYLWVSYFTLVLGTRKRLGYRHIYRNSLLVLVFAFIAMLVAHFTTYTFFGYTVAVYHIFFIAILISITESYVKESLRIEKASDTVAQRIHA